MKKIFFFILIIFPFYNVFPTSVGSPATPEMIQEGFFISDTSPVNFRLGFESYHASDLKLKFTRDFKSHGFDLYSIKANAQSFLFTFNIKERLDLYTYIGAMKIEPDFKYLSFFYSSKSNERPYLRAGAKLVLLEILDFCLSGDVKYSLFRSSADYLTRNEMPINHGGLKFFLKEWQIGVGLGYKISIFRPYFGIAYRDTRIKMKRAPFFNDQTLKLKFSNKAGFYLGTSASMGSYILLNAEARFINERSIAISGEIRF